MPSKRKIQAVDLVRDIRDGMSELDLMRKYRVSATGLYELFEKLVEAKALEPHELCRGMAGREESVVLDNVDVLLQEMRKSTRHLVNTPLSIYDARFPSIKGRLRDVSKGGVGLEGVYTEVGETRIFVISPLGATEFKPFIFEAVCRWFKESDTGDSTAGFEFVGMSEQSSNELKTLLQLIAKEAQ